MGLIPSKYFGGFAIFLTLVSIALWVWFGLTTMDWFFGKIFLVLGACLSTVLAGLCIFKWATGSFTDVAFEAVETGATLAPMFMDQGYAPMPETPQYDTAPAPQQGYVPVQTYQMPTEESGSPQSMQSVYGSPQLMQNVYGSPQEQLTMPVLDRKNEVVVNMQQVYGPPQVQQVY